MQAPALERHALDVAAAELGAVWELAERERLRDLVLHAADDREGGQGVVVV